MQHTTNSTRANRPAWWSDRYDSAWERVKAALARDFEQTKRDFGSDQSTELNQDVGDTVKQAMGKAPIPPKNVPNPPDPDEWAGGARYGYGAGLADTWRQHNAWSDDLETSLRRDWEGMKSGRSWDQVKDRVRTGFERARMQAQSHH